MNKLVKPFRKKELKKPVCVSLTDFERSTIEKAAAKEGLNLSRYVSQAAMHFAQA